MGDEQSKAAKRRYNDGAFHVRYFVGAGIDVGSGGDSLSRYAVVFVRIETCRDWDRRDGDAQLLERIESDSFDFLHSSHCLEHMVSVDESLSKWIRVVRPGGHLIITAPDEDTYERGHWPSRYNSDHKWSFTVHKPRSWCEKSINVVDLVRRFSALVEVERIVLVRDFFEPQLHGDQTGSRNTECVIEVVLRKRSEEMEADHG